MWKSLPVCAFVSIKRKMHRRVGSGREEEEKGNSPGRWNHVWLMPEAGRSYEYLKNTVLELEEVRGGR